MSDKNSTALFKIIVKAMQVVIVSAVLLLFSNRGMCYEIENEPDLLEVQSLLFNMKNEAALEKLDSLKEPITSNINYHILRAYVYMNSGKFEDSLGAVNAGIDIDSKNIELLHLKAYGELLTGNYAKLRSTAAEIQRLFPEYYHDTDEVLKLLVDYAPPAGSRKAEYKFTAKIKSADWISELFSLKGRVDTEFNAENGELVSRARVLSCEGGPGICERVNKDEQASCVKITPLFSVPDPICTYKHQKTKDKFHIDMTSVPDNYAPYFPGKHWGGDTVKVVAAGNEPPKGKCVDEQCYHTTTGGGTTSKNCYCKKIELKGMKEYADYKQQICRMDYALGTKRKTLKIGNSQYDDCFEIKFSLTCGLDNEIEKKNRNLDELSIDENYKEWYGKVEQAMEEKYSEQADQERGSGEYGEYLCISGSKRPIPLQIQGYSDYWPGKDNEWNMETDFSCTANEKPCKEILGERLKAIK
ncbi:MAG: hypothetical protein ABIH66_09160 [bacterium]